MQGGGKWDLGKSPAKEKGLLVGISHQGRRIGEGAKKTQKEE